MSELRYRSDLGEQQLSQLRENECTIFKKAQWWILAFCFRRTTDGKTEYRVVPVTPGGDPTPGVPTGGWGTWGLRPVPGAAGRWQITPSLACMVRIHDPVDPSKHIDIEVWHQTPAIIEVPDGEPWTTVA